MYQLFEPDITLSYPTRIHPRLDNLRRLENQNFEKVQQHYQRFTYFTKGEHPLVGFLRRLPAYTGQDYRDYYYLIKDGYLKHASASDFVCEQRASGTKDKQNISGNGYQDIIIGLGGAPFIRAWLIGWRDWQPVKVVRHAATSLRYLPFDGRDTPSDRQTVPTVYTVDVPLLALQYILYRNYVLENEGELEAYTHFLMKYPLVNALKSYNDLAIINRMNAAFYGLGGGQLVSPSIAVTDNHNLLDEIIDYQLEGLTNATVKNIQHHMLYYPTLWGSGYEAVQVPDVLEVRPTTWAWESSKSDLILHFLKIHQGELGSHTGTVNRLKRSLMELDNGRLMDAGNVDPAVRSAIADELGDIRLLLNR